MIEVERISEKESYGAFVEYGRMRRLCKEVDAYSCVYENNGHLYGAFSTGQTVALDKYKGISDKAVVSWLTVLYTIGRGVVYDKS